MKATFLSLLTRSFVVLNVALLCACSARSGVAPGTIPPPAYPDAQMKSETPQMLNAFISQNGWTRLKRGGALQVRSERVARKVLSAAGYQASEFPVDVVDAGEEVNAMVLNGSSIVVFQELLNRVNDEELAVVLSHEVGHLLGKHAAEHDEEESRAETVSTASSILGSIASIATSAAGYGGISGTVGDLTEGTTGMIGYGAYVGSFSRSQEYEADHIGLMLLAKAGYDPEAAIRFWAREEEVFGSASSSTAAFFSTHPAGSDRVGQLQEYLPLAQQYRTGKAPKKTL